MRERRTQPLRSTRNYEWRYICTTCSFGVNMTQETHFCTDEGCRFVSQFLILREEPWSFQIKKGFGKTYHCFEDRPCQPRGSARVACCWCSKWDLTTRKITTRTSTACSRRSTRRSSQHFRENGAVVLTWWRVGSASRTRSAVRWSSARRDNRRKRQGNIRVSMSELVELFRKLRSSIRRKMDLPLVHLIEKSVNRSYRSFQTIRRVWRQLQMSKLKLRTSTPRNDEVPCKLINNRLCRRKTKCLRLSTM